MTPGKRIRIAIACAAGVLIAGGCGLKGPLYLPDASAKHASRGGAPAPQKPEARRDTEPQH